MDNPNSNRIIFLNQLRGLAAIFVVCAHYLDNFWSRPKSIATVLHALPLEEMKAPVPAVLFAKIPFFSFGEFGVALFFLISGFVIPLSLEKYSPIPFLIARICRIWPTYLVGFLITLISLSVIANYTESSFPYGLSEILVHSVIFLRDWMWYPNIDGIVWTLEIEIKFYLFMAILFGLFGTFHPRKVALSFIFLCLVLIFAKSGQSFIFNDMRPLFYFLNVVTFNFSIIAFMLCGTIFYWLYRKRITVQEAVLLLTVFVGCFYLTWSFGMYVSGRYAIPQYILALSFFIISYSLRAYFTSYWLLDYWAKISYPLYVVHAIPGYALMYILIDNEVSPSLALLAAFISAFALASVLHYLVEKPSLKVGHSFSKRIRRV